MKTKYRLRHSADFQAVRVERKVAGDDVLRVQVRANSLGHSRTGVVVSKRIGGAVVRNRLRRRLQAALRGHLSGLAAYDIVLIPQPCAVVAEWAALRASLEEALRRTGVER